MGVYIPDAGSGVNDIELGDLNGDGFLDIVTCGFQYDSSSSSSGGDDPEFGPIMYINNNVSYRLNNGDGTFGPRTELSTNADPRDVTLTDLDGDGDLDIACIEFDAFSGLLTWFNNGSGSFGPRNETSTSVASTAMDAADVDGDGDQDILITRSFDHVLEVYYNNGSGSFVSLASYPTGGARPAGIDIGDTNGDGFPDVAVTVDSGSRLNVFTNDGLGGFGAMQNISTGSSPVGVRFADIDGDGDQDLFTTSSSTRTMRFHLNDGTGFYGAGNAFNVGGVNKIAVADLNNDGLVDLGMCNQLFSSGFAVHLNSPNGIDSMRDDYFPVSDPLTMSLMDFNADGKADIAVSRLTSSTPSVAVMINAGDGTYPTQLDLTAGSIPYLTTGDVNGDGRPDIVTANLSSNNMSVFINNGAGGYNAAVNTALGLSPSYPVLGDLDGDGDLDFTAASGSSNVIIRMLNNGSGVFGSQSNIAIPDNPFRHALGDVDGDGNLDIVSPRRNVDVVAVLLGNGDGTFGAIADYSVDDGPNGVRLADLDADGDLDFVVHNIRNSDPASMDSISIRFNNSSGVFSGSTELIYSGSIEDIHLDDIDGDGAIDIVAAHRDQTGYTVYSNNGDGTSWSRRSYLEGRGTRAVLAADINEDGTMDVIGAQASGFVSIHYGNACTDTGCPADFTGDGSLDIFDVFGFLDAFNSGNPAADFTGDGSFDIFDVFGFLDAFNAGCP